CLVIGIEFEISCYQGAQIIAKRDVDWREIVERTNAHVELPLRDAGRLRRNSINKIRVQLAGRQFPSAAGCNKDEILDARLISCLEAVEYSGHQNGAAFVRVNNIIVESCIWLIECRAQRLATSACVAELLSQFDKASWLPKIAVATLNLLRQEIAKSEVLQERDNIG